MSTGNYCVTVTDINGCTGSACQYITFNSNPTPVIYGATRACDGSMLMPYTDSYYASYIWTDGNTSNMDVAMTTGNYCVTVTDNNGCTGSACQYITFNPNPAPPISGGNVTVCANQLPATLVDIVPPGINVNWWDAPTGGNLLIANSATYSTSTAGTYYNEAVNPITGCVSISRTATSLTVNANPAPPTGSSVTVCSSQLPATLVDVVPNGETVNWYDAPTGGNLLIANSTTYVTSSPGTYYNSAIVISTGCVSLSRNPVSLTVNSAVSVTITGPSSICTNGAATLSAGSFASYYWSTGATTSSIFVTSSGNYCLTVSNAVGCTATACHSITISSSLTPVITGPASTCQGNPVTLSVGSFSSYLWSNGATTQSVSVSSTGNYMVTVSNSSGCTGTANQIVTVGTNPVPTINASGPLSFCPGNFVNLNVVGAYATYLWSNGATTQAIGPINTSGVYSVTVSYSTGCTGTASVTVNASLTLNPTITYTAPQPCAAASVVLSAGSYATYNWSTGATTPSITITSDGNYSVSVTNSSGCSGSASINYSIPFKASTTITSISGFTGCGIVTLDAGAGFTTYIWSNNVTNELNNITTSGTYTVTVYNAHGCSATASHSATILVPPTVTITGSNITTYCIGNGPAILKATASAAYLWSNGKTTQTDTIPAGNNGTYCVTVTSTNGCTNAACIILTSSCVTPVIPATPTTNIAATSAMANWIQPTCVHGYTIGISKHLLNVWTYYTFAPNSHYGFSQLTPGTCYDWIIRTDCSVDNTSVVSGFSAPVEFCTTGSTRNSNESLSGSYAFNVYPNPTSGNFTIAYTSDIDQTVVLTVVDMTGRIIMQQNHYLGAGENLMMIDGANFAKGVYLISLQTGDAVLKSKIVVQ